MFELFREILFMSLVSLITARRRRHVRTQHFCVENSLLSSFLLHGQVLRRYEYFGQYGKILKVVVNKNNMYNSSSPQGPTVSAYVTFTRKEDAGACIAAVDSVCLDGRYLRYAIHRGAATALRLLTYFSSVCLTAPRSTALTFFEAFPAPILSACTCTSLEKMQTVLRRKK